MDTVALDMFVYFFNHVDTLMLIFVRVIGFSIAVPVISSNVGIPGQARVFLAFVFSIALFLSGRITSITYIDTPVGYVYLIVQEFMVGMLMGFVAFSVFNLIYFAGQMMDHQVGFMMVNVLDPMTQIQVPIIGNLLYLVMTALLLVTGGLTDLFALLFISYDTLPIGTASVLGNAGVAEYVVHLLVQTTVLAARISIPIVGSMMVINAALGIMVKTVPQMNVFVVGIPIKMLTGLILLMIVMAPAMPVVFDRVFTMAVQAVEEVIFAMRP